MSCQADIDYETAKALLQQEAKAIASFGSCFAESLTLAFAEMRQTVNECCARRFYSRLKKRKGGRAS